MGMEDYIAPSRGNLRFEPVSNLSVTKIDSGPGLLHLKNDVPAFLNFGTCPINFASLFPKNRFSIIIELRPLKERASLLARHVPSMAHPKVSSPIFLFSLNNSQHCWHVTFTLWRKIGMETCFVISIGDVDSLVARDRMWIDSLCWGYAVFPFFLHLGMHHQ